MKVKMVGSFGDDQIVSLIIIRSRKPNQSDRVYASQKLKGTHRKHRPEFWEYIKLKMYN